MNKVSSLRNVSKEELEKIVASSRSRSEVLRRLKMSKSGAYFKILNEVLDEYGIKTDHFDMKFGFKKKMTYEEILVKDSPYVSTNNLKRRLVSDGLLSYECSECDIKDEYNGKPISLHLDHINGVNNDNRIDNLRLLCPNCHSQTPTYCGKHKSRK